jgi:hypothetical protein
MVEYNLAAENFLAHLRRFNVTHVKELWAKCESRFMRDPVKYPSMLPPALDRAERERFMSKCRAFCFPSSKESNNQPSTAEE